MTYELKVVTVKGVVIVTFEREGYPLFGTAFDERDQRAVENGWLLVRKKLIALGARLTGEGLGRWALIH